jgi:hypothetical protein
MKQLQDQRLQDVSNDMREARTRLNEVEDKLRAKQDVAVRRDVVAPEDGTVLGEASSVTSRSRFGTASTAPFTSND